MCSYRVGTAPVVYTKGRKRLECERETIRHLLSDLLGTKHLAEYAHLPNGAPYLPNLPDQHLSLSHTEGLAMVGLSKQPIGVDIERIDKQILKVQSRFVHQSEEASLHTERIDLIKALYILWTAKEAAYKLTNPPNGSLLSFCLEPNTPPLETCGVLYLSDLYNPQLITIEYQADEHYAQAIACHLI